MSLFHYRAFNAAGETVSGALEAEDLVGLENRLRTAGVWLLEAREGAALKESSRDLSASIKVPRRELISFFVQISLLLNAGVTLAGALERMTEDCAGTRLGTVLAGLHDQIAIGTPLNQAMAKYPHVFSRQVTAMIEAGEATGKMPEVFESLSGYYEWLDQLTGDIRQALIYPVMVISASSMLVLMLFTFVVPRFVSLLTDLHLKVPLLTQIVMSISNTLVHGWPLLLVLAVGLPVGFVLAMRSPAFALGFDRAMMRLPIFGELVALFGLSRFTHNLAMLYRSGIPLVRGLEICSCLVGNRAIEQAILEARRGVLEGTPLNRCLAQQEIFPRTLVTMIATGETSGKLDFSLQSVSEYYNKIIPRRIKVIFAIFDPVMMISLIAVVGTVALSVILPILQLWDVK